MCAALIQSEKWHTIEPEVYVNAVRYICKILGAKNFSAYFFHCDIFLNFRLAIPPMAMCFSVSTIFGSGLIFATGVLYGLMGLGKK